jgi:DNA repair protein RecO (recombination protein O)
VRYVAQFELHLLAELGFGLDLDQCAATGTSVDLAYVSPKTGRAVSREAGAPWAERLFKLPDFLITDGQATHDELRQGYALTGYFLSRHVLEPRGMAFPLARSGFISSVFRAMELEEALPGA